MDCNVDLHQRFKALSLEIKKSLLIEHHSQNDNRHGFVSLAYKFACELFSHSDFSHKILIYEMLLLIPLALFHAFGSDASFPPMLSIQTTFSLILLILWHFKWRATYRPLVNRSKILKICHFLDFLHKSVSANEAIVYPIVFTEPSYPGLHFVRIYSDLTGGSLFWIPLDLCSPSDLISLNDLLNLANTDPQVLQKIDPQSKVLIDINENAMSFCRLNAFPLCSRINVLLKKQFNITGKSP